MVGKWVTSILHGLGKYRQADGKEEGGTMRYKKEGVRLVFVDLISPHHHYHPLLTYKFHHPSLEPPPIDSTPCLLRPLISQIPAAVCMSASSSSTRQSFRILVPPDPLTPCSLSDFGGDLVQTLKFANDKTEGRKFSTSRPWMSSRASPRSSSTTCRRSS